jgi:hypothetical protein
MTSSWIALQAVALLVCLFLVSFSQSADAARWVDIDHQNEDIPSFRSLLHKKKSEKEMIKYCSKPKNRKKKVKACNPVEIKQSFILFFTLQALLKHGIAIYDININNNHLIALLLCRYA